MLHIPTDKWKRMLSYKPDVVLLHLGGNDIHDPPVYPKRSRGENVDYVGEDNQASVLFDAMNRRINELTRLGILTRCGERDLRLGAQGSKQKATRPAATLYSGSTYGIGPVRK